MGKEVEWMEGRTKHQKELSRTRVERRSRSLTQDRCSLFPSSSLHRPVSDAAVWHKLLHPPWERDRRRQRQTETERERERTWGRKVRQDYDRRELEEGGKKLITLLHSSPSQRLIYLLEFSRIKVILIHCFNRIACLILNMTSGSWGRQQHKKELQHAQFGNVIKSENSWHHCCGSHLTFCLKKRGRTELQSQRRWRFQTRSWRRTWGGSEPQPSWRWRDPRSSQ